MLISNQIIIASIKLNIYMVICTSMDLHLWFIAELITMEIWIREELKVDACFFIKKNN